MSNPLPNVLGGFAAAVLLTLFSAGPASSAVIATGACCNLTGCCAPAGMCSVKTQGECNGIADSYKGDNSTCEEQCPITTTTMPVGGACCLGNGLCVFDTNEVCAVNEGTYQGDGTTCETVECTAVTTTTTTLVSPTSTSTSTSTSTLPIVVICGDANNDQEITATDALIALKKAVGTAECSPQRCDYNGNGQIQSSDALLILRVAVGQVVIPMCPLI